MQTSKRAITIILVCCFVILVSYKYYKNEYRSTKDTSRTPISTLPTPEGSSWVWENTSLLNGTKVTPEDSSKFLLTFSPDGKNITSTTDCNTIFSTYLRNNEVLSFAPFASTRMFCKKSLESTYTEELALTTSYVIHNNILTLMLNRDAGVMTFRRAGSTQTASSSEDVAPTKNK
jgi:heat shock protein HslJ